MDHDIKINQKYGLKLFDSIRTIIRNWDPINLFPYSPFDEYDDEIIEIVAKLDNESIEDLAEVIETVFRNSFGDSFTETRVECVVIAEMIINAKSEIDYT